MKVGILLVTHSDIGRQLLLTATSVFGKNPFQVELLSVDNFDQPNDVKELAEKYVKFLLTPDGLLRRSEIFSRILFFVLQISFTDTCESSNLILIISISFSLCRVWYIYSLSIFCDCSPRHRYAFCCKIF